ncbi:MAG: transposase [Luteolibacter sp.]
MKFFDPFGATAVTRNNLPHWQQSGATYFVTYRLADSIPKELLDRWKYERETWLADNPEPWSEETEAEYHKIFSGEIDRMMDAGHGQCILRKKPFQAILEESFHYFHMSRYFIHSWVVMPNHVHVLFTLSSEVKLESVISTWKRHTARQINSALSSEGSLWQRDYFDRVIRDWKHFSNVARYIRKNPAKAKLRESEYSLW